MSRASLFIHGAGLVIAYSLYGVLQEKILKGTYGKFFNISSATFEEMKGVIEANILL